MTKAVHIEYDLVIDDEKILAAYTSGYFKTEVSLISQALILALGPHLKLAEITGVHVANVRSKEVVL